MPLVTTDTPVCRSLNNILLFNILGCVFFFFIKVVRQIFTAKKNKKKNHRGQSQELRSQQTKDTSQDRVQSEVTVSVLCEKGNVKTQRGAQAEWRKKKEKEGKTKRAELGTWCKNQNTNSFSLNANQRGKGGEKKECIRVKTECRI